MWRILVGAVWASPSELEETFARVREGELQGRWEEVSAACGELVATWPDTTRAETCERRLAWLDRRRDADGGLAGFLVLEGARRAPEPDVASVEQVRAASATSSVLAAEAGAWLAERALREGEPERALALADPRDTVPDEERALALHLEQLRAEALARSGREAEARAEDPEIASAVLRDRRRRQAAVASGVVAAAFALTSAPFLPAWREIAHPRGVWPIALGFAGAAAIGVAWEGGSADAAPWALAGALGVHALALPALHRLRDAPWRRRTVRALAALATLGLAYLAGWWTETLGWVGL